MEKLISKLKQYKILQIFTISLRYLIGASFVFASIVKIEGKRFTSDSGENAPINTAWHYFETIYQSGIYWNFIGWGQLIAGFLLMTQIFSTLGAVAFFSIILNIFFVTITYGFSGTPVITFLILLATIYLLIWDWNKLKFITLPNPQNYIDDNAEFSKRKVWTYLGISYFFIVILMQKILHGNHLAKVLKIEHTGFSFFLMMSSFLLICISWLIVVIIQIRKK